MTHDYMIHLVATSKQITLHQANKDENLSERCCQAGAAGNRWSQMWDQMFLAVFIFCFNQDDPLRLHSNQPV